MDRSLLHSGSPRRNSALCLAKYQDALATQSLMHPLCEGSRLQEILPALTTPETPHWKTVSGIGWLHGAAEGTEPQIRISGCQSLAIPVISTTDQRESWLLIQQEQPPSVGSAPTMRFCLWPAALPGLQKSHSTSEILGMTIYHCPLQLTPLQSVQAGEPLYTPIDMDKLLWGPQKGSVCRAPHKSPWPLAGCLTKSTCPRHSRDCTEVDGKGLCRSTPGFWKQNF